MNPISPFQYQRWESDDHHIIWLPPRFEEWEGRRSVYFTGSRGSGKTTLLRAFEWYERLHNESLRRQVGQNLFDKKYIGIYLSMPDYITYNFVNWPEKGDRMDINEWDKEKARSYSLYLEYQILQLFIKAIQGLRSAGILAFSSNNELKIIDEILSERPEIRRFLPNDIAEVRLNNLRLAFKSMHENLRLHAIHKNRLLPEEGYPVLEMGQMLEEIAGILVNLCSEGESEETEKPWFLKVCIDQAESQEQYQQKAINTIVARLINGDVSFVVASAIGFKDINETFIPHHQLSDDDRIYASLEDIYKKSKFHEFAESVTRLRFQKFTHNENISVDLRHILGDWDINELLDMLSFHATESKKVKEFMQRARDNIGKNFFKSKKYVSDEDIFEDIGEKDTYDENFCDYLPLKDSSEIPPYYQTYLIEKLGLYLDLNMDNKYNIRSIKSREFRKKMVSSMLCLCREFRLPIPFAGYTMVMSMSDTCIRDFLRIMHEIYLVENSSAEDFINKQISPKKQNEAIREASEKRYMGVAYEPEYHLSEIKRLVDSLGKITAEIQSSYEDLSALKNTERGIFEINFNLLDHPEERKDLFEIIQLARDSHCIKIFKDSMEDNKISFRLHKLFAPKFNFSYRGSYYIVFLRSDVLLNLCREKDQSMVKQLESREINQINKFKNQQTLEKWEVDNVD